jgi:hypothetical protein
VKKLRASWGVNAPVEGAPGRVTPPCAHALAGSATKILLEKAKKNKKRARLIKLIRICLININ